MSAIIIEKDANVKLAGLLFFGIPSVILVLAIIFPFFRGIFTFGSVMLCGVLIFAMAASMKDTEDKVVRDAPKVNSLKLPDWSRHVWFLSIIAVSAGLKLGWYIVPLMWLVNWIMLEVVISNVRKTFKKL